MIYDNKYADVGVFWRIESELWKYALHNGKVLKQQMAVAVLIINYIWTVWNDVKRSIKANAQQMNPWSVRVDFEICLLSSWTAGENQREGAAPADTHNKKNMTTNCVKDKALKLKW